MKTDKAARRRAGFSLVEVLITVAISAILLGATFMVIFSVTRGDQALRLRADMQAEATRAIKQMTELLRQSGPIDTNADWISTGNGDMGLGEFPVILDDTQMDSSGLLPPPYDFAINDEMVRHAQKAATLTGLGPEFARVKADTYWNGAGPSYEIIFRVATDQKLADSGDNDFLPIEGSTGAIQWGNEYHAFVVVPVYPSSNVPSADRTQAVNELQYWVYDSDSGATTKKTMARGVERLLIETVTRTEADPPHFPLDRVRDASMGGSNSETQSDRQDNWPAAATGSNQYMIRITLCMSRLGPDGNLITVWQQANVTMRCVNRS